jgi:hypothetical protein
MGETNTCNHYGSAGVSDALASVLWSIDCAVSGAGRPDRGDMEAGRRVLD